MATAASPHAGCTAKGIDVRAAAASPHAGCMVKGIDVAVLNAVA